MRTVVVWLRKDGLDLVQTDAPRRLVRIRSVSSSYDSASDVCTVHIRYGNTAVPGDDPT